ncbi:MAG: hypothetical protein KJ709_01620 [Nanoarchaeota archaeon]|nr:hypothetical protein [Nanoarchaeota archaeon]
MTITDIFQTYAEAGMLKQDLGAQILEDPQLIVMARDRIMAYLPFLDEWFLAQDDWTQNFEGDTGLSVMRNRIPVISKAAESIERGRPDYDIDEVAEAMTIVAAKIMYYQSKSSGMPYSVL